MASTTPNKEILRRLARLNGATNCYMLIETNDEFVEILTNIETKKIKDLEKELEEWAGMKFRVFNTLSNKKDIKKVELNGEKILPIVL